ncbi:hypothetical protein, conserved [Plasmodium gonderi]|uniref:Uncharacterized protein n=1 Tax=Plasmodium gonderi TaxID=77519 RepID=A0A1Y1JI66_PLAGO|nr:hypothetical protein, conserved [Plasmodium gonderi]GAW82209.1 hypothetical protein, conserved [Plasmodium gonderi]
MSDFFLGTKLTNHDVDEIRKEFREKRKYHGDEYDFYVYYKKVLAEEKKKKEKKEWRKKRKEKEQRDEEFKPCNYISSIYKTKVDIKKKNIYDYIDEEDSIYQDIVTSAQFDDKIYYPDDITFSLFNESVSYALLRNNNYIDGIPIGVDIKRKNKFLQKNYSQSDNTNESNPHNHVIFPSNRKETSPSPKSLPPNDDDNLGTHAEKKYTNESKADNEKGKDKLKKKSIEQKKRDESEKDVLFENNYLTTCNQIGPKLPDIFEEIRHQIGKETNSFERHENEYIKILSLRDRVISMKMKEEKQFEKLIKESYKPKNNFEGAFYEKNPNSIDQIKKRELNSLRKDFFFSTHEMDSYNGGRKEYMEQIDEKITGRKKQKFGIIEYEDYSDSSLEDFYISSSRKKALEDYSMIQEREKKQSANNNSRSAIPYNDSSRSAIPYNDSSRSAIPYNDSSRSGIPYNDSSRSGIPYNDSSRSEIPFVLCNTEIEHKDAMVLYSKFYRTLFQNRNINEYLNYTPSEELEDLKTQYSKLINPSGEAKLSKRELMNLYVPKKMWVHANSRIEDDKNVQNEIYALKNKINFNNDLKKKHRFYFYCKMKEKDTSMGIGMSIDTSMRHILGPAECEEFSELRRKLKVYYLDFYTKEIINEDLSTNFQMQEYEFDTCVCSKLGISDVGQDDKNGKGTKPTIVEDFLKIPKFVFEAIFCA